MKSFADKMNTPGSAPISILQKNSRAHVVYDSESQTYGHVLFSSNNLINTESPLLSNDHPCFIMIQQQNKDLELSIATSDIKLKDPITIELKGQWKTKNVYPDWITVDLSVKDRTKLTVKTEYYMPRKLSLSPKSNFFKRLLFL